MCDLYPADFYTQIGIRRNLLQYSFGVKASIDGLMRTLYAVIPTLNWCLRPMGGLRRPTTLFGMLQGLIGGLGGLSDSWARFENR